MSKPPIGIVLDENRTVYQPGESLAGEFSLQSLDCENIKAVEVSVLWYTEGKGDEDLAVHEFLRIADDDYNHDQLCCGRFQTVLPNSPLSYEGAILKIRWCVRVRVFPKRGRETVGELPFVLGNVSTAQTVEKQ